MDRVCLKKLFIQSVSKRVRREGIRCIFNKLHAFMQCVRGWVDNTTSFSNFDERGKHFINNLNKHYPNILRIHVYILH